MTVCAAGWKSNPRGGDPLDYFTIIPAAVRHDHELKPLARLVYGDISALARITGVCTATNATLGAENGRGKTAINEAITELEERGHILVTYSGAGNTLRTIIPLSENREGIPENRKGADCDPTGKPEAPLPENRQDPTGKPEQIRKKIYNNNPPISPKGELCDEVVDYLNQRTGSSFKASTRATVKCINARAKEGCTLDDFKAVIDFKANQWESDPIQSQYLCPKTLFGSNMESYLQAAKRKPKPIDIYAGLK